MKFPITKHYQYTASKHIARKLFLCRQCNKPCSPTDFKSLKKTRGIDLYLATAYVCNLCNVKFITNESLRQVEKTLKEKRMEYDLNPSDPYSETFEYPTEE